jgi:subtilase family serine protease
VFANPGYQTNMPCANRATTEISAVADPNTGLAVYNSKDGGWLLIGGTSASSPLIAAMFAAIGHGEVTPDQFPSFTAALHDVTTGSNGACGTSLCNADTGWDGPTGFGTPAAPAAPAR